MSLERRAQLLEMAASAPCCVRDAIRRLKWRSSSVVSMLERMENEGLVELRRVKRSRRGRPKNMIVCTPLGFDFLETYRRLKMKPLRARREDIERAVKDALYVERLIARGHLPFKLFLELNMIVHNIKVSSEAPRST